MVKGYDKFVKLAIQKMPGYPGDFLHLKKVISRELGLAIPTNADLREIYENLVGQKEINRNVKFENALFSRKIRTQSGVAVVAVLTKPYPCPGQCLYCPDEKNMPKSYLSNEPAVMRAISSKFDPYLQVQNRLRSLELNGHKTDKIELIVMGGTFSYLPKDYQKQFISECFRACNDYPRSHYYADATKYFRRANIQKSLSKEQKRNETAERRVVGLTLETRPDYIDEKEIVNFRQLGCTRVELGVQNIFDDILKTNKRGHDTKATTVATKLLKDTGFKIGYHIMPGLPGSSLKKDYKMFEKLFSCPDYQPDLLKIYPTIVERSSELYKLWKNKKYNALTDQDFEKFIVKVKNNLIPPYVRISRLIRDVPASSIVAGPIVSNLRQIIANQSKCPCIRCREVRSDYKIKEKIILDRIDYNASGSKEIFLQFVTPDRKKLFALLRLRMPANITPGIKMLRNVAIIREVHTYGKMAQISKKDKSSPQHEGLGKKLIREAERITKEEFNLKKIVVISGIGARQYYRKLGYRLKETYMVKSI